MYMYVQILQCQALRESSMVTYAAREQFTTNGEHIMLIPSGGRKKMIRDAGTGGRKFSPT